MLARFWGVNGTVCAPCLSHGRSGAVGNTTCIELSWDDRTVVYDAGTGFMRLGDHLLAQMGEDPGATRRIDLILSHPHFDHINGLLFSPLLFDPRISITLHASTRTLAALNLLLAPDSAASRVFFPATLEDMRSLAKMVVVDPGVSFMLGDALVETMALRHPGGCLGYRVTRNNTSIVLASDHEHADQGPDANLARFSREATLLYTEGQYTRAEYEGKAALGAGLPMVRRGWGHSTMEDCVATAVESGCRRLMLGHHDPLRQVASLESLIDWLKPMAGAGGPELSFAREGESIRLE